MSRLLALLAAALSLTACGPKECVLTDASSCPTDQVCEAVQGKDKPQCFAPVTLEGKVFDLSSSAGIAGAQLLATDENGAPAGTATISASDGKYSLRIPSTRTGDQGAFVSRKVLLRSQAKNYLPFPSGARVSLPIDTATATHEKDGAPWIVKSSLTDVGLSPVTGSEQNRPSVSGTIELPGDDRTVMLVLETGSAAGRTTLAGADGKFTFFNVPSGGLKIGAYARGVNYTPVEVQVASSDVTGVAITKAATPTATLSGSVQLVAGANNAGTSVVLVVESTFLEALGRGEVVPGLRAPEPGVAPNVTGGWTISGIPDGKYVVLAAFENDGNVRDPDPNISGTQLQRITVSNGALSGATSPSFKVTGAVSMVSPGREGVDATSATPTFTWEQYSNADAYLLKVFDSLGNTLWEKPIADKATVSTVYAGPALSSGQFYQWRLTALRRLEPTSQTEELRGLFRVE
ncbi:MAG: hypothetical protein ACOZQL_18170 [Myxococcota bacterium]